MTSEGARPTSTTMARRDGRAHALFPRTKRDNIGRSHLHQRGLASAITCADHTITVLPSPLAHPSAVAQAQARHRHERSITPHVRQRHVPTITRAHQKQRPIPRNAHATSATATSATATSATGDQRYSDQRYQRPALQRPALRRPKATTYARAPPQRNKRCPQTRSRNKRRRVTRAYTVDTLSRGTSRPNGTASPNQPDMVPSAHNLAPFLAPQSRAHSTHPLRLFSELAPLTISYTPLPVRRNSAC